MRGWKIDPRKDECVREGLEPPTSHAIGMAYQVVEHFKPIRTAPTRIVPNGEGGIIFEWERPKYFESMTCDNDGCCLVVIFLDGRIVHRYYFEAEDVCYG